MSQPNDRTRRRNDLGQTTPLVALLVALVAGAVVLVAELGTVVTDRARARTAADAAALAGAAAGEDAARQVAADNSAVLESYQPAGDDVEVTVRQGRARATARAQRRWVTNQRGPAG